MSRRCVEIIKNKGYTVFPYDSGKFYVNQMFFGWLLQLSFKKKDLILF